MVRVDAEGTVSVELKCLEGGNSSVIKEDCLDLRTLVFPFISSDSSHSRKPSYTIDLFASPISFYILPNPNSATVKMEATHFSETAQHIFLRDVIIQKAFTLFT